MITEREYIPTEGEEFLIDFFSLYGIKFESQKKIFNLKNDCKQFRTADFYLPCYKVYVEFFGLWNSTGNDEYKLKRDAYRRNQIPCIYIYPENLGILEFTFDKRLQSVLQAHNLLKGLLKYKRFKLRKSRQFRDYVFQSLIILFFIYIVTRDTNYNSREYIGFIFLATLVAYQIFRFVELYLDIFSRNKFPLNNLS